MPDTNKVFVTHYNKIIFDILLFSCLFSGPVQAAESNKYTPLFVVDLPYDASSGGNVVSDYMKASLSKTDKEALVAWEAFAKQYTDMDDIEDLTSLVLMRQASFELARLYYLVGRSADGDREIKRASEITAYSAPDPDQARRWCRSNNHCDFDVPGYLKK